MAYLIIAIISWILFAIASIYHIVIKDGKTKDIYKHISKSFIMPFLALGFVMFLAYMAKLKSDNLWWLVLLGMIFGWLGDVFLISEKSELLTILGLVSFLIGHIFYIIFIGYCLDLNTPTKIILCLIIIGPAFSLLFWKLTHPEGVMKIGLVVYSMAIWVLLIFVIALSASSEFKVYAFIFLLLGAITFGTSDGILSFIIIGKKNIPGWPVMLTYTLAQALLVTGFILQILA